MAIIIFFSERPILIEQSIVRYLVLVLHVLYISNELPALLGAKYSDTVGPKTEFDKFT